MATIPFVKMAAAGNDFIVIDNRRGILKGDPKRAAGKLCERKYAVGADGVLLLERSRKADIRMRIFNPDGSEADMCGNGVRCLARFAVSKKIVPATHRIETGAGIIFAKVTGDTVKARLTDPTGFRAEVRVRTGGRDQKLSFIDTGVPHAVVLEKTLKDTKVDERGRQIRYHARFAPKGANVNFVKIGKGDSIEVRTYERGVEGETLACGTGSTASALVASALKGLRSPVRVRTAGGETLKVHFKKEGARWKEVHLEGPVKTAFEGRVTL